MRIERLNSTQPEMAEALFHLLSEALGEGRSSASPTRIHQLLRQEAFWAVAAFDESGIVGGFTAHVLPMTKDDQSELMIYDIAIQPDRQRQGIGRRLMDWARQEALVAGIPSVFVLADNQDEHAIDFYGNAGGVASPVTLFAWN